MSRDKATVAVLMFDRAPMFETSVPISVFGADRTSSGAPAFTVRPVAAEPGPLTTTGGIQFVPPFGLDALDGAGIVVAPSWRNTAERPPEPALRALRAAHDDGALVIGQCMGAFVLAAAGLLDGRRAATHWFHAPVLAATYPKVTVDADVLYCDDGDVVTSGGSAAGIDACLHVVRRFWGASAATAIARRMIVAPQRSGGQAQFIDHPILAMPDGDQLARAMTYALEHLDEPLEVDVLAAQAHLSRRTFDRQFRAVVGISPLQWLLHQRILHAQRMLEQTDLPVDAIARRVGFTAGVSLRPSFRRIVGVSPQDYRNTFKPKAGMDDSRSGRGRANGHPVDRPAGRRRV
jgi:transcriptional regulator GlxA family with amidase domain